MFWRFEESHNLVDCHLQNKESNDSKRSIAIWGGLKKKQDLRQINNQCRSETVFDPHWLLIIVHQHRLQIFTWTSIVDLLNCWLLCSSRSIDDYCINIDCWFVHMVSSSSLTRKSNNADLKAGSKVDCVSIKNPAYRVIHDLSRSGAECNSLVTWSISGFELKL